MIALATVAVIAGLISMLLASIFFSPPKKDAKVPTIEPMKTSMPDIRNDPNYSSIFNENALDPTLPVQIKPEDNTTPFNSSQ